MTIPTKVKVSLSLSADLVALVDRDAHLRSETRSGVIERWLQRAATAALEVELNAATAAYYRSLRRDESVEDEVVSKALSGAARRVAYDEPTAPRRRRGAR